MPLFSLRLNRALANHLWIKLYSSSSIFDTDSMAWLILGDLNELSSLDEKSSFSKGNSTRYNNFKSFISYKNLIDRGFSGDPFSWHKKQEKQVTVFSRMDCAMANHLWIKLYPSSNIKHLPILGYDRGFILLDIPIRKFHKYNNFRFEAKWLLEDQFFELVRSFWSTYRRGSSAFQLIRKTNILKQETKSWRFQYKNSNNISFSRKII